MMNIYLETKFDAIGPDIAEIHLLTCLCISKMAAICDLGFVLPQFWTTHDIPVDGCIVPGNGVMIHSDVIELLRFYHFADLAENACSGQF